MTPATLLAHLHALNRGLAFGADDGAIETGVHSARCYMAERAEKLHNALRHLLPGRRGAGCVMSVTLGVILAHTGTVAFALIQPQTSCKNTFCSG